MRVYNFSPGPSALPLPVLEKAAAEMTDVNGTGQSAMEMSHRSRDFVPIIEKTEAMLRELMRIPDDYHVLFLQGGASLQFSMVPINFAGDGEKAKTANFIETGIWAKKAIDEAAKYIGVKTLASSAEKNYAYIPEAPPPEPDAAYYHITLNNTIVGTAWPKLPDTGKTPLVADVSSCILSAPLDVSRFGLIYAGAQKNLGPAGVTVVIIRKDLPGSVPSWTPAMMRYNTHIKESSMYNTPPCYSIYIMGLVLEWIKSQGGAEGMAERNREKAGLFYSYLDSSKHFVSPVREDSRSMMNIPFVMRNKDENTEKRFISEAAGNGLVNLAGHRLVGGMRASLYNAMSIDGVKALIAFMEKFEKTLN